MSESFDRAASIIDDAFDGDDIDWMSVRQSDHEWQCVMDPSSLNPVHVPLPRRSPFMHEVIAKDLTTDETRDLIRTTTDRLTATAFDEDGSPTKWKRTRLKQI